MNIILDQLLIRIQDVMPGERAPERQQRSSCNSIIQELRNQEDIVLSGLQNVTFANMNNDELTISLVEWNNRFCRMDELATRIPRELGAVTFKHMEAVNLVLQVQLAVARVISRAIAKLVIK